MKIESVIRDYKIFLDKIFGNLKDAGFGIDEFQELDHIAYRTKTNEDYEEIKNSLADFLQSSSEVIFSERLILIGRLKKSLVFENFEISGIEVLAPKENNKFENGLEHAEFVTKTNLSDFKNNHKEINFNLNAYERKENPELILEFGDCSVKFHEKSLLDIKKI